VSTSDKLKHLEELRRAAQLGGGEERIAQQHARGKLTARELSRKPARRRIVRRARRL
jgi:acetyl-CoA carboxylase carboxyltransferase component